MSFQPLYKTTATAHGGREGEVKSADGIIDLKLTVPKEMGGSGAPGANPETLFASGYSACFEGAARLVARTQKLALKDAHVTAQVTFGKADDGGFSIAVELTGKFDGLEKAAAQKLMEDAHQVCPYSRATRNNIEVKLHTA